MKLQDTSPQNTPLSAARLRALLAVVEEGSFAAAGRRLDLSHTVVAQHVRDSEREARGPLFRRQNGRLEPTPQCLEIVDIAQRMQDLQLEARRILGRWTPEGQRLLRVGLGNIMPGVAIVARLLEAQRDLQVEIVTGSHRTILAALFRREVDVALLPNLPRDPRLRRVELLLQEVVAIAPLGHPLPQRLTMADLAGLPLVFRSPGSSTQRAVDAAFHQAGCAPVPRLIADTRDAVCEAVAANVGVGFIWAHGTAREDGFRRIRVPDLQGAAQETAFSLAEDRNPLVDLFIAVARQDCAERHKRHLVDEADQ